MKRNYLAAALLLSATLLVSCQHQQAFAADPIGDGIRQHLASLNTLNLNAMEMNLSNVSINGNNAEAQVEFVPKTGAPPGAGMRVAYVLQKQGKQWVVVKTNPLGGAIEHPAPGTNPHAQATQSAVPGALPNFRDLIPQPNVGAKRVLPPGHPDVSRSTP
jgi:hypothetical protein